MLKTIDGKEMSTVTHREEFDALLTRIGIRTANAIRTYLDGQIDDLPSGNNHCRSFGSSELGRKLSPWDEPLDRLYLHSREFLGGSATEKEVEDQAALWFGLFVWERIMDREEEWLYYDPNLSANDVNREPLGKVYFEKAE